MASTPNIDTLEAKWWDRRYDEQVKSAFFSNSLVLEELYTRITGKNAFWLTWLFTEYFTSKPKNVLSIGCGDGAHELVIGRQNWADSVDAFDGSDSGIRIASAAARAENLNVNFYVDTFEAFTAAPAAKKYDVVIFIGSLHHVKDLEAMLGKVRASLAPNGRLVLNEYVGPIYNIYEPSRVEILNGLLKALDPVYKLSPDAQWRNLTIDEVLSIDPTESVRSTLIPGLVNLYFEPELERRFAGGLLHPIFDYLNSASLGNGSRESSTIVRLLIEFENILTRHGVVHNDFLFGVYKLRT